MTLRQFGSIEEAIKVLREEEGCLIYASDLNPASMDVRKLNWDVDFEQDKNNDESTQRPICVVMGNEDRGISDKMRELADETFYLPMCGFAESFNLSVATAITLAYMSAVSNRGNEVKGPLRPGDLDPHELQCLRLKGVLNSLAQKRMGKALLKKEGIVLPNSLYN
jgi:tRNA C32,U32 (ribose-2'-O)-methylase TrmJ